MHEKRLVGVRQAFYGIMLSYDSHNSNSRSPPYMEISALPPPIVLNHVSEHIVLFLNGAKI
jgi:hypothetical protein